MTLGLGDRGEGLMTYGAVIARGVRPAAVLAWSMPPDLSGVPSVSARTDG